MEMASQFATLVPEILDEALGNQEHFELTAEGNMRSLSIVLLQELTKFNILLRKMNSTLVELKRAIQGLAVMSQELDEMYLSFQNNVLPRIWRSVSYSSLKPLSSWFKDMITRVTFIRDWLHNKAPLSYWMSGLYFPQGFLTGVLQTHARLYKIPIDTLSFKFKVMTIEKEKLTNAP
jgi:dynein heavy chain